MYVTHGVGVQSDWIDHEIGRILKVQEHHRIAQNEDLLKERIKGIRRHVDTLAGKLKQVEEEMYNDEIRYTNNLLYRSTWIPYLQYVRQ